MLTIALELGEPTLTTWVDLACEATSASWSWGTSEDHGVTTLPSAGQGSITVADDERRFDPDNTASDLYGLIDIGTPFRIRLGAYVMYTGYLDTLSHDLRNRCELRMTDPISRLTAIKFVETSRPAESSSARAAAILAAAKWPATSTDVEAGGVNLQAGTFAADGWTDLATVTRNELGLVWADREGVVRWRKRATAWAESAPAIVLGCQPADGTATGMELGLDPETLINQVSAARRTGTARVFTDGPSLERYGAFTTVQHDLEVATDGDRDFWALFYLDRQAYPSRGMRKIQVSDPDELFVARAAAATFGSVVEFHDDGHYGPPFTYLGRLLGWQWAVSAVEGGGPAVIVTLGLGRVAAIGPRSRSLIIDTPAEWAAVTVTPAATNLTARAPGLEVTTVPVKPAPASSPAMAARPAPDDDYVDPDE